MPGLLRGVAAHTAAMKPQALADPQRVLTPEELPAETTLIVGV